MPWLLLMTSSGWRQQREYCYFWVIAKRLQKIDTKKLMNQLISVGGPDHGQEKAVGNSSGTEGGRRAGGLLGHRVGLAGI